MKSDELIQQAIDSVAVKSPGFFQDMIFMIEAGLMRQLSEKFPEQEEILIQRIARNVQSGLTQCAVRVAFTEYGAEDVLQVSMLIRERVEKLFFQTINSNPAVFGGAIIAHWSGEEAPNMPFIQQNLVLN